MELTKYSKKRFQDSFSYWNVDDEFAHPVQNYLLYGFEPGSCFTAVLANDFLNAMLRSHPANTVEAFKALARWIVNCMPHESFGSYDKVQTWLHMDEADRRAVLEQCQLIYTEKEEVWMALRDTPVEA
jgi:hypothetical protein